MTAESTVPSPGAQPWDAGHPPVSVLPARPAGGLRFPLRRLPLRPASRLPLLAADLAAALAGAVSLDGAARHPLWIAALVSAALLLRPRSTRPVPGVLDELPAVCGRIAVAWLGLAALLAAHDPGRALSVRALLLGGTLHAAAACAGRGAVHWRRRAALLRRPRTALVVGPAATAQQVAAALLRHPRCGVRPVGVVTDRREETGGLPVLTTGQEVERALIQNGVRVVLTVGSAVRGEQGPLLRALAASGCTVWEVDAGCPAYETREQLAGFPVHRLELGSRRRGGLGKRLLDLVVSGALLALASPVLLVCAVVLRLTGGPGVVFRQERVGQDGRPFTLLKFRTHRPVDEHEAATRWSVAGAREMRPFCRFLRRTSLDELLQLWNVFRGDMSLVGPRPERPYFVTRFSQAHPGYAARHRVRTGITGLAQIHGLRGDTSIEDRARFDNAYIDNWSLWQDVCILLRTATALVRSAGS
ncbi:exopolysaccharide biosynthesis polyprenyl glycosylphosphotransferase [Streptomyces sp. TG1A-8]|uniref:exopolysaccharide biosynthesis polyprenyl glycosylphosphotransferase n=1 Tax=Streptomyces sp. TG1A-8 TaxID=3051385 RepID=UPI00265C5FFF|nr:exopolysaccharide biosynthesis polyprenyl glycosylphosphotransferase [Streptomyces sp. TG1A-8]MDO0927646.1 exopolysaccharide biosynthesis polyprenyl glycosylphosphotransferase [Streptomyces sp. TG1A-8]